MKALILVLFLAYLNLITCCSPSAPCVGTPQPCCSTHNYCGTTSAYCGPGNCTHNCWAGCKLGGANSCASSQCCSQYGYCGTSPEYCSPQNYCFSNCKTSSSLVFVAYIPSWTVGYNAPCNLNLATLNVAKFTHLLVPFAIFDTTNFILSAQNNDDTSGWYAKVQNLKSKNSNLKVLISIGGGAFGSNPWATMVSTAANRNKFIFNAIQFARNHKFDGIDIDWEAPDSAPQTPQINNLFSSLRAAITNDTSSSGKPALLLTIASPNYQYAINLFDFPAINQYLDWINVMSYDYYGEWSSVIGANTAFAGSANLDVTSTLSYFSNVPASKLVMGFANYARTFTLTSSSGNTPGSTFSSLGAAGPCTSSPGTFSYYEVANYISTHSSGSSVFDIVSKTPYFYYGTQWITYDNLQSLQIKVNSLLTKGLKGAMVWALDGNSTLTDIVANNMENTHPQPPPQRPPYPNNTTVTSASSNNNNNNNGTSNNNNNNNNNGSSSSSSTTSCSSSSCSGSGRRRAKDNSCKMQ